MWSQLSLYELAATMSYGLNPETFAFSFVDDSVIERNVARVNAIGTAVSDIVKEFVAGDIVRRTEMVAYGATNLALSYVTGEAVGVLGGVAKGGMLKLYDVSRAGRVAALTPEIESVSGLAKPMDRALINRMEQKGWTVVVAKEGSEDFRYLSRIRADASINDGIPKHIVIKETAPKSALLEEFLHNSQLELGLLEKYDSRQLLEVRVKDFMLHHAKMLGLDNPADIKLLQQLKSKELSRLFRLDGK